MSWTGFFDTQVPVVISAPHLALRTWASLPDDDMNPGRAKRCLLMSFLC
jgi:hypothetical protein